VLTYARVNLGYILGLVPARRSEAQPMLEETVAECRAVGNRRLEGWARGHLAWLACGDGEHAAAAAMARQAVALLDAAPGLQSWALTAQARALLGLGQSDDAVAVARRAVALLDALGGILQGEGLPYLVLAEALAASGDMAGARAAVTAALARLERRLARLPDPAWREPFLALPGHRDTLALARQWGVGEATAG
jgi:tetratricopeptide (TPR) repeat protein